MSRESWGYGKFFSDQSRTAGEVGDVSLSSLLAHLLLWMLLPGTIVSIAQSTLYRILPRYRPLPSQEKRRKKHYLVIYAVLLILYILYAVKQTVNTLPTNYYTMMEVSPEGFKMSKLRANYRHYSLMYHPDKLSEFEDVEGLRNRFLELQKAYNVLKDATLRQAYSRFGEDALKCTSCKSERDYFDMVFWQSYLVFYLPACIVMLITVIILPSKRTPRFWNVALFFSLASIEAFALLHGVPGLRYVLPKYTLHEKVLLLRQFFLSGQITLNQLGAIVTDLYFEDDDNEALLNRLQLLGKSLLQLSQQTLKEHINLLGGTNPESMESLALQVSEAVCRIAVSKEKQIQTLISQSALAGTSPSKPSDTSRESSPTRTNKNSTPNLKKRQPPIKPQ